MKLSNIDNAKNIVTETINKYNLKWDLLSVEFVLDDLKTSFDDLQYDNNIVKNVIYLVQCGLNSRSREQALKILDEMREAGVSPRLVHYVLVEILKDKHFFSTEAENAEVVMRNTQKAKLLRDLLRTVLENEES